VDVASTPESPVGPSAPKPDRVGSAKLPIGAIAVATGALVAGGLTVNTLTGSAIALPYLWDHLTLSFLLSLAAFLLLSTALYRHRADFRAVRTLAERHARPKSAIILLLSSPSQKVRVENGGCYRGDLQLPQGDAGACIKAVNGLGWNWQQLLRALDWHRSTLKHVYLIGSDGGRGSFGAASLARELVEHSFGSGVDVRVVKPAVSFENLQALLEVLRGAISALQQGGIRKHDIAIDVTGGHQDGEHRRGHHHARQQRDLPVRADRSGLPRADRPGLQGARIRPGDPPPGA
jgi:hypothetical protein